MLVRPIDFARELEVAARLLADRWTLALPTAIAAALSAAIIFFGIGALVIAAIAALLIGGTSGAVATLTTGAFTVGAAVMAIVLVSWVAHVVVVAAAHAAWAGRPTDFGAAFRLVLARLPALLVAFCAVGALTLIPFVLCFVLIGFPLLALLGYFTMYAAPAILIDGEGGIAAIRTSFRMAVRDPGPSAIGYGGILGAFLVGRIADAFFVHIPLIGVLGAFVIGGLTAAYGALVSVRFYELLRAGSPARDDVVAPAMLPGS